MKKGILFSVIAASLLANSVLAYAINDVNPIQDDTQNQSAVILMTDKYKVVQENDKFSIIDLKTGNNKLGILAESIELFDDEFEDEYKIKFKNETTDSLLTGYFNTTSNKVFITNYDEMYLLGKYIKIKSVGKYGLIDKEGNTILMPIYDRIGIFTVEDNEYITAKINGTNKLFYSDGKIIPDEELYTVSYDGIYAIASDLKPEFKKYVVEERNKKYLKVSNIKDESKNAENTIKEVISEESKVLDDTANEIITKTVFLAKKEFAIINNDSKLGLIDIKGNEIIPAEYENIIISNLKNPIIVASKDQNISTFDIKGNLISEKVNSGFNVYKYGKTFNYEKSNDVWILKENNKELGTLTIENDSYIFTKKNKYNLFNYTKINDIFWTTLNNQ